MSPIIRSGAFLQQCFAAHRLCLCVKKLVGPEQVLLLCTSCKLQHHLTVRAFSSPAAESLAPAALARGGKGGPEHLGRCATAHPTALGIGEMDVFQDFVRMRCGECRRVYDLDIAAFETHQR